MDNCDSSTAWLSQRRRDPGPDTVRNHVLSLHQPGPGPKPIPERLTLTADH